MFFKDYLGIQQGLVSVGHNVVQLLDSTRGTNTSNDVFALSVHQEFTCKHVFTSSTVTGEANACSAVITKVSINHGLNVNGGAPIVWNAVKLAILDCPIVHPGIKDSIDSKGQLIASFGWERLASRLLDGFLGAANNFIQLSLIKIGVFLLTSALFHILKDVVKGVMHTLGRLHSQNNVAKHLQEATIRVQRKAAIVGHLCQAFHHLVIQAQVQDGVHHAWH